MFTNPITSEVFVNREDFVDSLANSLNQLTIEKNQVALDEEDLLKALHKVCEMSDDVGEVDVDLVGKQNLIKVSRGVNSTYPKERGQEHPLDKLIEKHPFLKQYVVHDPREKGSELDKFIANSEHDSRENVQNARKDLLEKRVQKNQKIKVTVVVRPVKEE